jgi:hypothetical protein
VTRPYFFTIRVRTDCADAAANVIPRHMSGSHTPPGEQLRVLVRCARTHAYLDTGGTQWTEDRTKALAFLSVQQAIKHCHDSGLVEVNIVAQRPRQAPLNLPLPAKRKT